MVLITFRNLETRDFVFKLIVKHQNKKHMYEVLLQMPIK